MIYRRPRKFFVRLMVPVLALVVVAGLFGLVWLRSQITSAEYRIGKLEAEKQESTRQEKVLYARMSSMLSIQQVSLRGLDLTFPDRTRVIYVKRDEGGKPYAASLKGE